MEFIYSNYDLEYVLEEVEVIEINEDEAKDHYIQTTRVLPVRYLELKTRDRNKFPDSNFFLQD